MKTFLLFCATLFTQYAWAEPNAIAQVQATVIATDTPILIQQLPTENKVIEIIATIVNNNCSVNYSIIIKEKEQIKNVAHFSACSMIVRAKIIKDKLLISIPDQHKTYVSYTYNLNEL